MEIRQMTKNRSFAFSALIGYLENKDKPLPDHICAILNNIMDEPELQPDTNTLIVVISSISMQYDEEVSEDEKERVITSMKEFAVDGPAEKFEDLRKKIMLGKLHHRPMMIDEDGGVSFDEENDDIKGFAFAIGRNGKEVMMPISKDQDMNRIEDDLSRAYHAVKDGESVDEEPQEEKEQWYTNAKDYQSFDDFETEKFRNDAIYASNMFVTHFIHFMDRFKKEFSDSPRDGADLFMLSVAPRMAMDIENDVMRPPKFTVTKIVDIMKNYSFEKHDEIVEQIRALREPLDLNQYFTSSDVGREFYDEIKKITGMSDQEITDAILHNTECTPMENDGDDTENMSAEELKQGIKEMLDAALKELFEMHNDEEDE